MNETGDRTAAAGPSVTLEGDSNFRDLGGHRTADGGRVRFGLIFRSGSLHKLTDVDVVTLERLGLKVVYDLRADDERTRAPSILPDGIRLERLPIGGQAAKSKELYDLVIAQKIGDVPSDFLFQIYASLIEAEAPTFGELLTRLTEPNGTPALFHCTAGKDRTGVSAALLLSVLGVDEATILDDYERSALSYTEAQMAKLRARLEPSGIDVERYKAIFGAPRDAMATLLATIRERYGSVERYLEQEAAMAPEAIAELRTIMVEAPDGH